MSQVVYVPGSSQKVCQLTGQRDRERQQPTPNRTEARFGLVGTDLGFSFEHEGRLYFLFGDTFPTTTHASYRPEGGDAIAWTNDATPDDGLTLHFITAPDGHYLSPRVPGIDLGWSRVPVGGFSLAGNMYVIFVTDYSEETRAGRSVMARSRDDGRSFEHLYDIARNKFYNISPAVVNNADWPGLPAAAGQGVLMWGSGKYRQSDPYLAYVAGRSVEDRPAWRFFAGTGAGNAPQWSARLADAVPLFSHPVIGELSVTWNRFLRKWLMLYNSSDPRGVNFRVADRPWGPWSQTGVLFHPNADNGYCHFIHRAWTEHFPPCDHVHDPGKEAVWGGDYGPYLIQRYTQGDSSGTTIYWVMSTWNPYNVVLMRSRLRRMPG